MGQGPILIYPYNRAKFTAPLFRVPEGRHVFAFALPRNAVPPKQRREAAAEGGRNTPAAKLYS